LVRIVQRQYEAPLPAASLGSMQRDNQRQLTETSIRPMRETTFMGMTIQAGTDLAAFMNVTRSPRAFTHAARRFSRHLIDLALYR
jgi:hypothetical protein